MRLTMQQMTILLVVACGAGTNAVGQAPPARPAEPTQLTIALELPDDVRTPRQPKTQKKEVQVVSALTLPESSEKKPTKRKPPAKADRRVVPVQQVSPPMEEVEEPETFDAPVLEGAAPILLGPPGRWVPRLELRHLTRGAGYEHGYSSIGLVTPLYRSNGDDPSVLFGDARMLVSDYSRLGANAGLLYRTLHPVREEVDGAYLFYDNRDAQNAAYNQIGFGFDRLKANTESRVNVYLPFGPSRHFLGQTQAPQTFNTTTILGNLTTYEAALFGLDGEKGWALLGRNSSSRLWGFLGGYYYAGHGGKDVWGVKTRAEVRIRDYMALSIQYQLDSVNHSNTVLMAEIYFPGLRPRNAVNADYLSNRLGDPVRRTQTITVANQSNWEFP